MEAPNKLMIMQALGRFRYDSMIPNGLMWIFSGAPCVIRGVLGEIGVVSLLNDGDVQLRRLGRLAQNEPSSAIRMPLGQSWSEFFSPSRCNDSPLTRMVSHSFITVAPSDS